MGATLTSMPSLLPLLKIAILGQNAFKGNGGNVNIDTSGVFGLAESNSPTEATSDITASSELGLEGTVEIDTPEVDPSRGLVELPTVTRCNGSSTGLRSRATRMNKANLSSPDAAACPPIQTKLSAVMRLRLVG